MNREEILRNLEYAYERFKDKPTFTGEINVGRMISDVISFIKENTDDWIPLSEGLPDKNGNYIVSLEDAVDTSAWFFNGKWFMSPVDSTAREYGEHEVIAWMPRPESYKGGDTE